MNLDAARPLHVGIAGLGMAGAGIVNTLAALPQIRLVAAADPRAPALAAFRERFRGHGYQSLEGLCADPKVEAVWLATPTHLHCEQAIALAEHGKHVVVEKPLAVSLEECERMIAAAERNGIALIAGGARSFEPAFAGMRRIIASGRLGRLGGLTTWAFLGWMLRPREPHEVDVSRGGGAVYNQAPHAVDVLRLLGGGLVRSVRAMTGEWLPERPCPGYFCAYLEFEDGTPATLVYNGYGYLHAWELLPWGETPQRQAAAERASAYRRQLRLGTADEYAARERLRFGGLPERPAAERGGTDSWTPGDAGLVIASCERGELRQSATGLYVYDDDGRHDEPLPPGQSLRLNEVTELLAAIGGRPALHDGRWGMATLEVVLAIMQSAAERKEIRLRRQAPYG
ncbi:MAG TPA: Gfo/Idh/MocA family oxidoreductase [Dehalococcoidia bacterium]|nr:Gfo/Idh/MocA family oxidoreductase [Dehalococcoidia bacterium]